MSTLTKKNQGKRWDRAQKEQEAAHDANCGLERLKNGSVEAQTKQNPQYLFLPQSSIRNLISN